MTSVEVVSELHSLGGTIELIYQLMGLLFFEKFSPLAQADDIKCNRPGSRYLNVPTYTTCLRPR